MLQDLDVVTLSRLQFAITALYHFLFVPLTMGLSILLGIMESVFVLTGHVVWRDMTKFFGKCFGINFAMGVATGITLEFQFGTNWAYYSHYVGDIFAVPLAIEGMMAFFLESSFVGLFFFGWHRLSKIQHLTATWLMAIGSNLSALWILIANGWMQNPVGAEFNPDTMRMELVSIFDVIFNEVAQAKFVHTVSAGYVTGAMFVLAVSSYYLLRGKFVPMSQRAIAVASSFGLASALCVIVLGDESGYTATHNQKAKLAAIEAMWETEEAPAAFTVFGIPNSEERRTDFQIQIPYVLGIIATRSLVTTIPGINDLEKEAADKIRKGIPLVMALESYRSDPSNLELRDLLKSQSEYLGYGLLALREHRDLTKVTPDDITKLAQGTIPNVPVLFFSFRIMVFLGFYFLALFTTWFYFGNIKHRFPDWLCKLSLYSLPLPWVAAALGWIIAEYGRQPWAIEGILPTFLGVSDVGVGHLVYSLTGFILFYTVLFVVDIRLMLKSIRLGPTTGHERGV